MHSKRFRQLGFSVIELLVTLAIVSIVVAVALPAMSSILGGSKISSTTNQLVYSLQSARSEAIKRIAVVGLCPSEDPLAEAAVCGGSYTDGWIVFVDEDGDGMRTGAEELILQNEALSSAFTVTPDSAFGSSVLFSISGTSVSTVGTPLSGGIAIGHSGVDEKRNVRIAASGRISSATLNASDDTGTDGLSGGAG